MVNLWQDIEIARNAGLKLVHLTAQPVSVADISQKGFGKVFNNILPNPPASYDMQTSNAQIFGGSGRYQYSDRETFLAVRSYAQSEQLVAKTN